MYRFQICFTVCLSIASISTTLADEPSPVAANADSGDLAAVATADKTSAAGQKPDSIEADPKAQPEKEGSAKEADESSKEVKENDDQKSPKKSAEAAKRDSSKDSSGDKLKSENKKLKQVREGVQIREGVYVSAPSADKSFRLLGEFAGEISGSDSSDQPPRTIGLQLRPVSGTDFDAMILEGGLPGVGATFIDPGDGAQPIGDRKPTPMRLVGRRNGDVLVLSGGPFAIFVDPGGCTLIDPSGKNIGRLDRVVRTSPSLAARPPKGAIVLFGMPGEGAKNADGKKNDHLVGATVTEDGLLEEGFTIKPMIQDFDLHVEFRLPYMPRADGQKRGNSGIYIHSRYECQVLDSFAKVSEFSDLGAIYRFKAPRINMALPPLSWQTYDIRFTAARFNSDGSKFSDARLTSWVNGVKVQDDVSLPSQTGHGKLEEPILLPTHIQDHGDPVRYRNLWIIDRGLVQATFPVTGGEQSKTVSDSGKADDRRK